MKHLKLYESYSPLKFDIEEEDEYGDRIIIKAILDGEEIGKSVMEFITAGYWEFEDEMTEEEYDKHFPEDSFAKVEVIEIKDDYKRKGYATELMSKTIEYIKSRNFKEIYLNASPMGMTGASLTPLVNFYKKFGFKTIVKDDNNEEMVLHIR